MAWIAVGTVVVGGVIAKDNADRAQRGANQRAADANKAQNTRQVRSDKVRQDEIQAGLNRRSSTGFSGQSQGDFAGIGTRPNIFGNSVSSQAPQFEFTQSYGIPGFGGLPNGTIPDFGDFGRFQPQQINADGNSFQDGNLTLDQRIRDLQNTGLGASNRASQGFGDLSRQSARISNEVGRNNLGITGQVGQSNALSGRLNQFGGLLGNNTQQLQNNISGLQGQQGQLDRNISGLQGQQRQIGQLNSGVGQIGSTLNQITGQFGNDRGALQRTRNQIGRLGGSLRNQSSSLADNNRGLGLISGDIGGFSNQIGGTRNQLGGISDTFGGQSGRLGQNINELRTNLGQIQGAQNQTQQNIAGLNVSRGTLGDISQGLTNQQAALDSNQNAFTQARVNPLEQALASRQGSLERDLNRRGVTGSFANQAINNLNIDGQRAIGDERARAAQESIAARNQLSNQQAGLVGQDVGIQGQQQQGINQIGGFLGQQRGNIGQQAGVIGQQSGLTTAQQGVLGQQAGLSGQQAGLSQAQQAILGQQANLTGQQTGLTQAQAGLFGQQAGITGQQSGLTSAQQGVLNNQAGIFGQQAGLVNQQSGLFRQQADAIRQQSGIFGQQANTLGQIGQNINQGTNIVGQQSNLINQRLQAIQQRNQGFGQQANLLNQQGQFTGQQAALGQYATGQGNAEFAQALQGLGLGIDQYTNLINGASSRSTGGPIAVAQATPQSNFLGQALGAGISAYANQPQTNVPLRNQFNPGGYDTFGNPIR